MKTLLLFSLSFSIALAQVVSAEGQEPTAAAKSRPKVSAPTTRVAPAVLPKTHHNIPATAVPPKVNRPQPPVNQPNGSLNPNVQPKQPVPADLDAPRPVNKTGPVSATIPPYAQPDMIPRPAPRPVNKTGPVSATVPAYAQPDMIPRPAPRDRSADNGRNRDNRHPRDNPEWRDRNITWQEVCRRHPRQHHPRVWWTNHFTRFALFGTGYYFWDNGYWFPAYGYDPSYNTYAYEEPIYSYGGLDPDQVVANVQTELQNLGYYPYEVDGLMGPETRTAIANYQRDNGLEITSAVDESTLESLGLDQ